MEKILLDRVMKLNCAYTLSEILEELLTHANENEGISLAILQCDQRIQHLLNEEGIVFGESILNKELRNTLVGEYAKILNSIQREEIVLLVNTLPNGYFRYRAFRKLEGKKFKENT